MTDTATDFGNDPIFPTVSDDDRTQDTETADDGGVEKIERPEVNGPPTAAVDAALEAIRERLLNGDHSKTQRKAIAVTPSDRRKVRRRNVDTDVSISDLVFDSVIDLLSRQDDVHVASARASKNRSERLTLTAPQWWWTLAGFAADSVGGSLADVIATGIGKRLP